MGKILSINRRIASLKRAKYKAYFAVALLYFLVITMFVCAFWIHPGLGFIMLALWGIYLVINITGVVEDEENGEDGSDDRFGDAG